MVRRGRCEIGKAGVASTFSTECTPPASPWAAETSSIPGNANTTTVANFQTGSNLPPVSTQKQLQSTATEGASADLLGNSMSSTSASGSVGEGDNVDTTVMTAGVEETGRELQVVESDDQDAIDIAAFDAALALCTEEASDVHMSRLRSIFAAIVERTKDAMDSRDMMEARCNELAAESQAIALVLANRRAEVGKAQAAKLRWEPKCRELTQLTRHAEKVTADGAAAEEVRMALLAKKFDAAVPSINEKLRMESDRRKAQREDNENLRARLSEFAEQARLTEERYADQLKPGSMEIEIALAQCNQQEALRRGSDERAEGVMAQLGRAKAEHAKKKKETTERERYLSKIQGVWNGRKRTVTELESKVKELRESKEVLETEMPLMRKAAASEEAANTLRRVVGSLQGLCNQLEPEVEAKRVELSALRGDQ